MPRPYVSSFEDVSAPKREAVINAGSGPLATRPPLVRQKAIRPKAKPRARTSAEWYVVQAFADCLSRERERRGWGMTALAAHIGMSVSQYRKMENGHLGSTIRLANKVCRRLGITFSLGEWPE
jgi:ribosome-binding protein aMBF1 (putative translation factor)